MGITWITAFLDTESGRADASETFWVAVTGWPVGQRRGPGDEFATLEPPHGDAFLKVQVVGEPTPGGTHLDLHSDDEEALAADVVRLGGTAEPHPLGYVVCRSPGGLAFCVVGHEGAVRPEASHWPGGRSLVDQVCLDIPSAAFDTEADFWSAVTGWSRHPGSRPEFDYLERTPDQPLRILLQRLGGEEVQGPVRAHLDLESEHRDREVERHLALGATLVRREARWTTLSDPAGRHYCVTDRGPLSA